MTTLTVNEAQAKLPALIRRAKRGEKIGIVSGGKVIRLTPTELVDWEDTYLYQEYGVTPAEWERFRKRMQKERAQAIRAGTMKAFTGDIEKDLAD